MKASLKSVVGISKALSSQDFPFQANPEPDPTTCQSGVSRSRGHSTLDGVQSFFCRAHGSCIRREGRKGKYKDQKGSGVVWFRSWEIWVQVPSFVPLPRHVTWGKSPLFVPHFPMCRKGVSNIQSLSPLLCSVCSCTRSTLSTMVPACPIHLNRTPLKASQ